MKAIITPDRYDVWHAKEIEALRNFLEKFKGNRFSKLVWRQPLRVTLLEEYVVCPHCGKKVPIEINEFVVREKSDDEHLR